MAMSKKDSIKAHIDTLRALCIAILGALFGMFGYALIHISDGFKAIQLLYGLAVFILLCVSLGLVVKIYLKKVKELEHL